MIFFFYYSQILKNATLLEYDPVSFLGTKNHPIKIIYIIGYLDMPVFLAKYFSIFSDFLKIRQIYQKYVKNIGKPSVQLT